MKLLVGIILALGSATAVLASASVLDISGGTVQQGVEGADCDADGVGLSYDAYLLNGEITAVDVTGVDAGCAGDYLSVELLDSGGGVECENTITAAAGTNNVVLDGTGGSSGVDCPADIANVEDTRVTIATP